MALTPAWISKVGWGKATEMMKAGTAPQTGLSGLLQQFQQQEDEAKAANLQRYEQAMAIYDEIIRRYQPGGEFGKAALGQLEQRKVRDVGAETQQLISSGLYGTTSMGATGRRWEEAVGAPERLRLEDIQMQRLSEAQVGKAGFIERREDVGPDYNTIAQLAAQAGQQPSQIFMTSGGEKVDKGASPWDPGFLGGGWGLASTGSYSGGGISTGQTSAVGGTKTAPSYAKPEGEGVREIYSYEPEGAVLQAATAAYKADMERVHGAGAGAGVTTESYQKLLATTPRNPSRGVWKAWVGAGGK